MDEQKVIDLHEEASENIIQGEVSSEPPQNSENKYNVFRRSDKKVNRKDVGLILPVMSQ